VRARLPELDTRISRELAFWRDSPHERPGAFDVRLLVHKMSEGLVLLEGIDRHRDRFEQAGAVLELGGGQGWGACLVKSLFDGAVVGSDISAEAIASVPAWEHVTKVTLDRTVACPSFDVPLSDGSFDLVFTFQAAHHFGAHRRTLAEAWRLLKPGGAVLYLQEPTAPDWIYSRAIARANRKRAGYGHDVVEDVLIPNRLLDVGRSLGFAATVRYAPTVTLRGRREFLYYLALGKARRLQRWLPCTADFVFEKPR
jgi:SAM-dependent methyltransferase